MLLVFSRLGEIAASVVQDILVLVASIQPKRPAPCRWLDRNPGTPLELFRWEWVALKSRLVLRPSWSGRAATHGAEVETLIHIQATTRGIQAAPGRL
jgi:hypothetical protein